MRGLGSRDAAAYAADFVALRQAMACRALLFRGTFDRPLNRTYSLKRHKEFRFTYRTGRQVGGGSFVLVTARNRKGKVQVGFSVSKKIGNSVMRNRAKRRLKACFSPLLPQVKPGYNLIFIARSESLTAPFLSMQKSMVSALKRAGVFEEAPKAAEVPIR